MKTLKLTLSILFASLLLITSCTNDESAAEDQQNTQESVAIKTALNELKTRFDSDGNVNPESNVAGNIIFDYGFDFQYPLTLSYSNGTTVTANTLKNLAEIAHNTSTSRSSQNDFDVDGIVFPFDVEYYDFDTDTIVTLTINNEQEFLDFIALIESTLWNDDCVCNDEYAPVCIEVTNPNDGSIFVIAYPNACEAMCDGFTDADFSDECSGNGSNDIDFLPECFTFNYPLNIAVDNGEIVTVNSDEEFNTTAYNNYTFDFVYPFSVTLSDDSVVTINDELDLINLFINNCSEDDGNDGGGNELCEECYDAPFDPICVEYDTGSEVIVISFPNACFAECQGFTADDFIVCD